MTIPAFPRSTCARGLPLSPDTPGMPTPAARFHELANEHAAVARLELAGAGTSLLARDADGRPELLEVIARGEVLESAAALEVLAQSRGAIVRAAEQATDHLVAGIALRLQAGEDVNIAAIARDAGLSRQTIYTRLAELGVTP
jgi:DNA-binding phage protein